jgi:hypothetical protein
VFARDRKYAGYPESKFRWAVEKKREFISKPFILPFDVHTVHYFSTYHEVYQTQFREEVTVKFVENAGKVTKW